MTKNQLNDTEVWHIAAEAFHSPQYRGNYIEALSSVIADRNLSILDTACGSGFPATDLYKAGFSKLEASDADSSSVTNLRTFFKNLGLPIPVSEGRWQELAKKVHKKFDVIINMDNSFVYMDGWTENRDFKSGIENISERVFVVLKNFYDVLNENGTLVIGLGKHYHPGTTSYSLPMSVDKNAQSFQVNWSGVMDWMKRENKWTVKVTSKDSEGSFLKKSYLLTKEEIADIMQRVGFKKVVFIEPKDIGDNFIVGSKS